MHRRFCQTAYQLVVHDPQALVWLNRGIAWRRFRSSLIGGLTLLTLILALVFLCTNSLTINFRTILVAVGAGYILAFNVFMVKTFVARILAKA